MSEFITNAELRIEAERLVDENAKLREFAARVYKILSSPSPYTPQQVVERFDLLDWIDKTAVELGIEVQ